VVLLQHLRGHADLLGDEMARAEANPLRILDSKRPDWQPILEAAPQLGEYLSDESAEHFARVQTGLRALDIPFELTPRLVRGFDYYTRTTFELQSDTIDAAQNALGGGGRYDRLAEEMGGPPTPSIGFAAGIERILLACDAEVVLPPPSARVEVFVVDVTDSVTDATVVLNELRERGIAADRAYGGRTGKKQWGAADKSGAVFGVMLAPREQAAGTVAVKDLRSGEQVEVERSELAAWLLARTGAGARRGSTRP
jgi:histidyl-tRNA synthetase